jgi:predicted N-acetyltransferase YhbS
MIVIDERGPQEAAAAEALRRRVFGGSHLRKTSQRLREGRAPAEGLELVAREDGALVGSVVLWEIALGAERRPGLLLGPLAVHPDLQGLGVGAQLMRISLARAAERGHGAVVLVGDAPYYGRFGFQAGLTGELVLPGPFERHRFLGLELRDGWLQGAAGLVTPAGRKLATWGRAAA